MNSATGERENCRDFSCFSIRPKRLPNFNVIRLQFWAFRTHWIFYLLLFSFDWGWFTEDVIWFKDMKGGEVKFVWQKSLWGLLTSLLLFICVGIFLKKPFKITKRGIACNLWRHLWSSPTPTKLTTTAANFEMNSRRCQFIFDVIWRSKITKRKKAERRQS